VAEECSKAERLDDDLVERWMAHRNDVSALHDLTQKGFALDTMEVAGPWAALPDIYARCLAALQDVDGMITASAHQSHAYGDGACLYFTFVGKPERDRREAFYVQAWDAAQRAALDAGAALSHHHGVGLNRGRFMEQALGAPGLAVLQAVKDALDPAGVLNPGKLGLRSPFGEVSWP
jgi:alkyldihydroxyacetonephosphate synthase